MKGALTFRYTYSKNWLKAWFHQKNNFEGDIPYKDIGIINPSIGSANLGDHIIYKSVYKVLRTIYPDAMFSDFPAQLHTSLDAMLLMKSKYLLFISGTNLLSSNLEIRHQWKIYDRHKSFLNNKVVLLGCGWWQYQNDVTKYTKAIYKKVLNRAFLHSVRDRYTEEKLINAGITNVINTCCPTFWGLTPEKCKAIPRSRARQVVTTLTFYHKNINADRRMLEILSKHYEKVYLWAQGADDLHYLNELNVISQKNIVILPPTIEAYDTILLKKNIDYIGTRLHAGARALQNNIRSLIVAVDNRAREIGSDVNLNVIDRKNIEEIIFFIDNDYETHINLPTDNIKKWFASLNVAKK